MPQSGASVCPAFSAPVGVTAVIVRKKTMVENPKERYRYQNIQEIDDGIKDSICNQQPSNETTGKDIIISMDLLKELSIASQQPFNKHVLHLDYNGRESSPVRSSFTPGVVADYSNNKTENNCNKCKKNDSKTHDLCESMNKTTRVMSGCQRGLFPRMVDKRLFRPLLGQHHQVRAAHSAKIKRKSEWPMYTMQKGYHVEPEWISQTVTMPALGTIGAEIRRSPMRKQYRKQLPEIGAKTCRLFDKPASAKTPTERQHCQSKEEEELKCSSQKLIITLPHHGKSGWSNSRRQNGFMKYNTSNNTNASRNFRRIGWVSENNSDSSSYYNEPFRNSHSNYLKRNSSAANQKSSVQNYVMTWLDVGDGEERSYVTPATSD